MASFKTTAAVSEKTRVSLQHIGFIPQLPLRNMQGSSAAVQNGDRVQQIPSFTAFAQVRAKGCECYFLFHSHSLLICLFESYALKDLKKR